MTVCIATICNLSLNQKDVGSVIIGVSDRMITAGDIQFELQQPKIQGLTRSIVAMVAGDMAVQSEIIQGMMVDVAERAAAEPNAWLNVRFVADAYVRRYHEIRRFRAENAILAPLGLTTESFIVRQKTMAEGLVADIARELLQFDELGVEALIVGLDPTGAHIFMIHNGRLTCEDAVGFAAIGIGHWHANSQLMAWEYVKTKPFPEALYLAYSAKRRAEVAPGVGAATDIFTIGPTLGMSGQTAPSVIEIIKGMYDNVETAIKTGMKTAMGAFNEQILKGLGEAITQAGATAPKAQTEGQIVGKDELATEPSKAAPNTAEKTKDK